MREVSEAARAREVLRYKAPVIAATRLYAQSEIASSPPNADFNANPLLTSLVQLAAWRFDAAGAIISLFDEQNQYFIAQASQTSSIIHPGHDDNDDGEQCSLVGKAIPRPNGFCEDVLLESDTDGGTLPSAESVRLLPVSVVPDIASSPHSSRLIGIPGLCDARFYAAVPIRSPRGINIGVFAVYGSQPRTEIEPRLITFLRDMSSTVTSHLDSTKSRIDLRRSERMVRGLGSFVEGTAGMSFNPTTSNLDSFRNEGLEGTLNTAQQEIQQLDRERKSQVPHFQEFDGSSREDNSDQSRSPEPPACIPARLKNRKAPKSPDTRAEEPPLQSIFPSSSTKEIENTGSTITDEDEHASSVKRAFGRAANIIRESIEVEGVAFIDASLTAFGGLVGSNSFSDSSTSTYSSSEESLIEADKPDNTCDVLGYSTTTSSSLDENASVPDQALIPEKFLKTLLRRYPEGKIFHFGGDGSISATTSDFSGSETSAASSQPSETKIPSNISESTVNKPKECQRNKTWSRQTEGISMSSNPKYNSELRSPLHGVIAAAELLHDTSLDAFQCDVLHSLESCGRVLLDVLNHLLDYSKINTVIQDQRREKKARKSKALDTLNQPQSYNQSRLSTYTHIDSLFEESIDSVFAGHMFQKLSIAQLDHRSDRGIDALALRKTDTLDAVETFGHPTGPFGQLNIQLGDVSVFVDIDPSVPWGSRTQPGALRRIILNILGNSLRFTDRGLVVVTLRQEKTPSRNSSHDTSIKLTVADTGRGIGSYFMQHHLFTPFSQEDPLSPGTGLGLSLVKKIVRSLHGNVSVRSQVGVGTRVQVTVPVPEGTDKKQFGSNFADHKTALDGLRVSLFGLSKTAWKGVEDEPLISEYDLMHKVCSKWLKLQVVGFGNDEIRPDLVLCSEPSMEKLLRKTGKGSLSAPTVVICKDATVAHEHNKIMNEKTGHRILEFISQPIGPRKLAKSLDAALRRWTDAAQTELSDTASDIATPGLQPSTIPFFSEPIVEAPNVPESNSVRNHVSLDELVASPEFPVDDPKTDEVTMLEKDQKQIDTPISNPPRNTIRKSGDKSRSEGQNRSSKSTSRKRTVLLVDDNSINLRILVTYMKKLKRPYKTATNGLEAYEAFAADPSSFSCILMDISMPIMDGLESTRKIRELERSLEQKPAVTIIALTGLASLRPQQEAYASGMDIYLTKPVELQALAKTLAERDI
ncbi:hypothetical protein NPX13_g2647 [Xylaria arbuscula]|uniref:Histidine kinase n=1 Tax=Xylaria arbuscula TaxID=114810 RepID=A0A9W8NKA9_9PEZI|nr:hypothetical protein NPX13_g2647 [Xylaria arbuscula]